MTDKKIQLFWDNQGLLVQHYGGGGETLADTGTYIVGKWLTTTNELDREIVRREAVQMWITHGFPDNPSRHPTQIPGPEYLSYDQMNSNIIGMGLLGLRPWIRTILGKMLLNGIRFPNGDPASPERLNVVFRALGWWWLYPLFVLGDAWMLLVMLPWLRLKRVRPGKFRTWLYKKLKWNWLIKDHGGVYGKKNVGDCRNYRLMLIQANLQYSTWFSSVALLLYEMWFRDAWTIFFQIDNRLDILYDGYREEA